MTAIASTDVSITIPPADRDIIPAGRKVVTLCNIAFGDGSLTYETGGVPLPAIGSFGMKKQLQRMMIQSPYGSLLDFRYDPDNHKIKIIDPGTGTHAEFGNGSAIAAVSLDVLVVGE